jgi:putative ABC transport system permease protein
MKWLTIFRNAWSDLNQHKLRSSLSVLGIVFAILSVVSLMAVTEGAKRQTLNQIGQLGTKTIIIREIPLSKIQEETAKEYFSPGLSFRDVEALRQGLPHTESVAPLKEIRAGIARLNEGEGVQILAVTAAYRKAMSIHLAQGRFIGDLDSERKNLVCVLGKEVAALLGHGGQLGQDLFLEELSYRIVGILPERNWQTKETKALNLRNYNRAIFIPLGSEPQNTEPKKDIYGELNEILVKFGPQQDMRAGTAIAKRILTLSHKNIEDYQIIVPYELIHQAQKTQNLFNTMVGCIAGISLLVGGIGIMNVMLASISERTREIGIRRAIGASKKHIINQFLSESIVLTVLGAVFGIVLGLFAAVLINSFLGWPIAVTLGSIILPVFLAIIAGILSGLYPAIKASKLDPITALRPD